MSERKSSYFRLDKVGRLLTKRGYARDINDAMQVIARALASRELKKLRFPQTPELLKYADCGSLSANPILDAATSTIVAVCKAQSFPWDHDRSRTLVEIHTSEIARLWSAVKIITTRKSVKSAISDLTGRLKRNPDLTKAQAWRPYKGKISELSFTKEVWPEGRQEAGLSRRASSGRPRKKSSSNTIEPF